MLSGVSLALFGIRLEVVMQPTFSFLTWNLFLAWIPFGLAASIDHLLRQGKLSVVGLALGVLWLLFLPNAPYLVTDLVHVETSSALRALLDGGTIVAYALTGLALGYASLIRVHEVIQARLGAFLGWLVALGSLAVSGVGIYLGRVVQLNSWDVLVRPGHVLATLRTVFADPLEHLGAVTASSSTGALLAISYIACRRFRRKRMPPLTRDA
jgi:uncharacterized membrane protein